MLWKVRQCVKEGVKASTVAQGHSQMIFIWHTCLYNNKTVPLVIRKSSYETSLDIRTHRAPLGVDFSGIVYSKSFCCDEGIYSKAVKRLFFVIGSHQGLSRLKGS